VHHICILLKSQPYQQAVVAITRKSMHLVFNLNTQVNSKAWEAVLENNFHLLYLEMSSLPISASSLDMTTVTPEQDWIKGLPDVPTVS
jgi:hypothetical protein